VINPAVAITSQWENKFVSMSILSVALVKIPAMVEYFKGLFLADHTLSTPSEPAW